MERFLRKRFKTQIDKSSKKLILSCLTHITAEINIKTDQKSDIIIL